MKGRGWPSYILLLYYVIVDVAYVITASQLASSSVESDTTPDIHSIGLQCMLDEQNENPELLTCLEKGTKYLDRYFTELRWKANMFNRCSELPEFRDCLRPLLTNCPTIRRLYAHWARVLQTLECSCDQSDDSCSADLRCFEEQSSGALVKGCDAHYKFNIEQHTRDRCHFISENVHCKEALMTSACGHDVGDFAFSVYHVTSPRRNKKRSCDIPRQPEEPVFSYGPTCPVHFPAQMEQCRQRHLPQMLSFHKDLDLVAIGRKLDIKNACRSYRDYRNCVRPIKMSCRKGMHIMYDNDGRLRTYLTKMEYICGDSKEDYLDNVPCYRDVLREERLSTCDTTWSLLQSMLSTTTSHTYYCRESSDESVQLNIVLDEFRQCYENQFTESCGHTGSQILDTLMRTVLHDPHYLRYKYKPDCRLHKIPKRTPHRPEIGVMSNSSSYEHNPSVMEMSSNAHHRQQFGYIQLIVILTLYILLGSLHR